MTFPRKWVELVILNEISRFRQQNTMLYIEHKIKIAYVYIFAYICVDHEARKVIMRVLEEILMWGCRESNGYM